MPVSNPQKTVFPSAIGCGERAKVTISFDAAAALVPEPMDLILLMDRSASMSPPRLEEAQAAADTLIGIVTGASGGTAAIEGGSSMGIASFSSTARVDLPLTTDREALEKAVNSLRFGGSTNHKAAFETAGAMLPGASGKRQIVVIFTDGVTTAGGDAAPAARKLKDNGIEIYCIGLLSDASQLEQWASKPVSEHVAVTEDPMQLERLFREIASSVVLAGAVEPVLREKVSEEFRIVKADKPSHGTVELTGPRSLVWLPGTVGLTPRPERVRLTFEIRYAGKAGGVLPVNECLDYEDRSGNRLLFPSPLLEVGCGGGDIYPEPCPEPVPFRIEGCRDAARVSLPQVELLSLGRIVQVDVTVKNLCPGRRVALSVMLWEREKGGRALPRGVKHVLIPPQTGTGCRDLTVQCIPFSLPEALRDGDGGSICTERQFEARAIANYVDTDFACCETETVLL